MRLTQNNLRRILNYDSETGVFIWKFREECSNRFNGKWVGKSAGTLNRQGRMMIFISGKLYSSHRLAWLYVNGNWPDNDIDHINGDPSDNRIENLRVVTHSENMQNMRLPKTNNRSGYLGVSFDKRYGKYEARITTNGKRLNLGRFDCPKEASEAYLKAKRELHTTCTI